MRSIAVTSSTTRVMTSPVRTRIEPSQRQTLDFLVEIGANVIDDPLLEVVIEDDAGAIQGVFEEKAPQSQQNPGHEVVELLVGNDFPRDVSCHQREK